MNYHNAKKHRKATAGVVHKCKICDKDFHSFYLLREYERRGHGAERSSGVQNVDVTQIVGEVDENTLREELETYQRFLVDNEMENRRHRVYNFAMDTQDPKCLLEKLDVVFDSLKRAAKLIVAFGFVLKNVEDGGCRYKYAQENITLMERSILVATTEDLTKSKNLLSKTCVIESCTRE